MSWLMATPWMGIASASCETKLAESTWHTSTNFQVAASSTRNPTPESQQEPAFFSCKCQGKWSLRNLDCGHGPADVCIINPGDHHQGICATIKNAPVTQWIWKCWKHFFLLRKDVRTSTYKLPFVKELRHVPALMDPARCRVFWPEADQSWVNEAGHSGAELILFFWHGYSHARNHCFHGKTRN